MAFGSWQFRRWADRWNKLSECCTPDENSLPERGGGNTLLFPPTLLVPRSSRPLFLSLFLFSFAFVSTHFSLSLSFFHRGVDALATLIGNNKRELDAIPKGNFSSSRLTTPIPSSLDGLEDPWIRFHTTGALLLYIIATVYVIEATTTTTMMGARISRK